MDAWSELGTSTSLLRHGEDEEEESWLRSPQMMDGVHEMHHPDSERCVHPSKWCVTLQDLDVFEAEVRELWQEGEIPDDPSCPNEFHNDPEVGPTIHQVNKYYIKPLTLESGGMSWALMRNLEGLECDIFATHCWAEGVFEFVSKVRRTWPRGARHLWVCFLANPQNGNLGALWQGSLQKSPFARALRRANYLLVIPNRRTSIYSRLWCVYEAFLSLQFIARNDLVIKLPSEAPVWKLVACLGPGLLVWLACGATSFFMLAPSLGYLLPPLLWLIFFVLVNLLVSWSVKRCAQRGGGGGGSSGRVAPQQRLGAEGGWRELEVWEEIALGWLQLAIIGLGFGFVQHGFRDLNASTRWAWEPGEGWACGYLTLSVVLMYLRGIADVITQAVTRAEGILLDFSTVRAASCTNLVDEQRIREAIDGYEDLIDQAIMALRTVGRFDSDVMSNMHHGMSAQRARDGPGLFRVTTACSAWSYWWVTDLSAHHDHIFATEALLATCAFAVGLAHWIGDQAIFAMDAFFYAGIAYVVTTSALARFWWNSDPFKKLDMSYYSLPLQLLFFAAMCLADLWHYGGFRKRTCSAFCEGPDAFSCPVEEDAVSGTCEQLRCRSGGGAVKADDLEGPTPSSGLSQHALELIESDGSGWSTWTSSRDSSEDVETESDSGLVNSSDGELGS